MTSGSGRKECRLTIDEVFLAEGRNEMAEGKGTSIAQMEVLVSEHRLCFTSACYFQS